MGNLGTDEVHHYPVPLDQPTLARSDSFAGEFNNIVTSGDETTVDGAITGHARISTAGGALREVRFEVADEMAMDAPPSTSCGVSQEVYADLVVGLDLPRGGFLTLDLTNAGAGRVTTTVRTGGATRATLDSQLPSDHRRTRVHLPAGKHQLVATVRQQHAAVDGDLDASGTAVVTASFVEGGLAAGPARGRGTSFVGLPATRDCAGGAVTPTFRRPARKVAKATFFVNGAQRRTVRNPRPNRTVRLRGLAAAQPVTIRAVLRLDPPRKGKKGRTRTVTRSYTACSA
ncbi:hypothetical protein [Nocardioides sp. SYSU D00038]|uniref:hypothetical protein n=1 Tax=Nocardioides sp. SYSU D00038 TaxID=2812554 RepID=UPI0019675CF5|nr:hypothetical protein [Nocardioides sp. SYSU D00038]